MKDASFTDKEEWRGKKKQDLKDMICQCVATNRTVQKIQIQQHPWSYLRCCNFVTRYFSNILAAFCFFFDKGGKSLPFQMATRRFSGEDLLGVRICHHGYRNDQYVENLTPLCSFIYGRISVEVNGYLIFYDSAVSLKHFSPWK